MVYLNSGADGWVIANNAFVGKDLTLSPLLGVEGNGHHVYGNSFDHADGYVTIEAWTPSVIFENNGDVNISFAVYDSTTGHNGS